jgi:hypothetical protein
MPTGKTVRYTSQDKGATAKISLPDGEIIAQGSPNPNIVPARVGDGIVSGIALPAIALEGKKNSILGNVITLAFPRAEFSG